MKSNTWDDAVLADHRASIKDDSARDAFDTLVAVATQAPRYETEPVRQGRARIFKYLDTASGQRPFSFTVSQRHLLFHVRAKGIHLVDGGFAALRRQFDAAVENKRGEWTVRIASKADAERLSSFLFPEPAAMQQAPSVVPAASADEPQATSHHWWVNHSQASRQETAGNYLWSPKKNENSAGNDSYNMTRVLPGDIVYSFADAAIRAVGIVLRRAHEAPRPGDHGGVGRESVGWQLSVRFRELETPLHPKDYASELAAVLPKIHSPIRAGGEMNPEVYLAAVPPAMATTLRALLGPQVDNAERKIKESVGLELLGDIEEGRLDQRTDLQPVEKERLIGARRGQGRYRQDLEKIEIGCRLTGLIDRRHLRASHIKPWWVSDDREKLDPNNGLLSSPHIDHLFTRGYISFTDEGDLLVSRYLNPVVLNAWGLTPPIKRRPFSEKQCVYLDYHRTQVFEGHGRGKESDEREAGDAVHPCVDIVLHEVALGGSTRDH